MMKISKKASAKVTMAFLIVCLAILTVLAATAWDYRRIYFANLVLPLPEVVVFTYLEVAAAFAAVILLILLMRNIGKNIVFDDSNTVKLRAVSWLSYLETLLFCGEATVYFVHTKLEYGDQGLFFFVMIGIAFAFALLGTIVRVAKNIMEEATAIKEENDFTI